MQAVGKLKLHTVRKLQLQKWLKIKDLIATDARSRTMYIAKFVCISVGAAHTNIRRDFKVRWISARWKHYYRAKKRSGKNLQTIVETVPYKQQIAKIITGDKTCVNFYDPNRTIHNKTWATKGSQIPCIAKHIMTVKKDVYVIFFINKDCRSKG
jgi:hypothetical protein